MASTDPHQTTSSGLLFHWTEAGQKDVEIVDYH